MKKTVAIVAMLAIAFGAAFGQKLADKVAELNGSWAFILFLLGLTVVWVVLNSVFRITFDEYPYQFFNLALAILVALQGPLIVMSQNRQSLKDRAQAETDFRVNLKNEAVDIEVFARPHDVSIGTISGDIRVRGTLRNLSFEALNEETALQAGLSALLASISGPLGLLPFIQTGGEPDAPCATLLADAKETGTRNNPAQNVTPKKG